VLRTKEPVEKMGMQVEQREILLQVKPHKLTAYFVYSEAWMAQRWSERSANTLQTRF